MSPAKGFVSPLRENQFEARPPARCPVVAYFENLLRVSLCSSAFSAVNMALKSNNRRVAETAENAELN